jgi:putative nucleotidyltransferase with HDIG domain
MAASRFSQRAAARLARRGERNKMDRASAVRAKIEERVSDLPVLPSVAAKVLEISRSPDTTAEQLAKTISLDGSVSSKVLRLANSAYYGFRSRISTITHAIVILGFNAVSNLTLSSSVIRMFGAGPEGQIFSRYGLWKHSLASGAAARILAEKQGLLPTTCEQAFVAGLLHDLGKAFLDSYFPREWRVAVSKCAAESLETIEAEADVFGVTHTEVGALLADKWGFPDLIALAIAFHHSPRPEGASPSTTELVHAADYIARTAQIGSSGSDVPPRMNEEVRERIGLTDAREVEALLALKERIWVLEEFLHLALENGGQQAANAA